MSNSCVALVPCRSGSRRLPNKNIQLLNGHPLMAYSICAALDSGIFERVIVSTDSEEYASIARKYGAETIIEPLPNGLGDIKWVTFVFDKIGIKYDAFSILRPTSPFRTASTIQRAWAKFLSVDCDSLRAIEECSQHPYKMWLDKKPYIEPLIKSGLHSMPYQLLPKVYVQNASLEITHTWCVTGLGSISGEHIIPFFTYGYEGFDINFPRDLREAEYLIESGQAVLPEVRLK